MSTKMKKFARELPTELETEVLARLPVKSLVRLRCVRKGWCSLISSPDFASLHLDRYHNHDDHTLVLAATRDGHIGLQWMLLSGQTYEKLVDDGYAYAVPNTRSIMDRVGPWWFPCPISSHGLILMFSNCSFKGLHMNQWPLELLLWNPMIGKAHKITPHCKRRDGFRLGFGFSRSANNYKVVVIATEPKTSAQVYSLHTCSWRDVTDYRESIIRAVESHGFVLVEGMIHFISNNSNERSCHMVMFDVNDEMFSYVELPPELRGPDYRNQPVIYQEKIGIFSVDRSNYTCSLWLMKSDRMPVSWSRVYNIDLPADFIIGMLCFKKNGQFVLRTARDVQLYDMESGEVKHLTNYYAYRIEYCTLYKEGLALI